jgi:ribosomal protein L3 glutamine methyltransferase
MAYPDVTVDAADSSDDALAVAHINVEKHSLTGRITVMKSDLLNDVTGPYDLIICNPPYVNAQSMAKLPKEYTFEPSMALAGGDDGMDLVRRIVNDAAAKLSEVGVLLLEIGNERAHFEHAFRKLEVVWLETSAGDDQVLLVTRESLARWNTSAAKGAAQNVEKQGAKA